MYWRTSQTCMHKEKQIIKILDKMIYQDQG